LSVALSTRLIIDVNFSIILVRELKVKEKIKVIYNYQVNYQSRNKNLKVMNYK